MGWRIIKISNSSKLELKADKLFVRYLDDQKQIFINEIDTLIIENTAITVTASLLNELAKSKVNIIFCDEKRNPSATLNLIYGSYNTSNKVRNQILWEDDIKNKVWSEIIKEKIYHQMSFLKELNHSEYKMLEEYISQVKDGDSTNREAYAAKVYFNSLFGMSFSRNQDISINAALNYGYSIILSYVNREIISNGYITQLGIHHDNQNNFFNLGCDFMEPIRPFVDRKVYHMKCEKFEKEEKAELIKILNEETIVDGKTQYLSNAISIYVASILQCIDNKDIQLIKRISIKE